MRSCSFSAAGLWTNVLLGLVAGGAGDEGAAVSNRLTSPQPASKSVAPSTSAAEPKPPHDKRRVRIGGFRSISGTEFINWLAPLAFRSSQRGIARPAGELRKAGASGEAQGRQLTLVL